jgi:hypothetical protein
MAKGALNARDKFVSCARARAFAGGRGVGDGAGAGGAGAGARTLEFSKVLENSVFKIKRSPLGGRVIN